MKGKLILIFLFSELLSEMKIDKRRPPAPLGDFPISRSARVQELARKFQNIRPRDGDQGRKSLIG